MHQTLSPLMQTVMPQLRVAADAGSGSDTGALLSPNLKSAPLSACNSLQSIAATCCDKIKTVFYNDTDVESCI